MRFRTVLFVLVALVAGGAAGLAVGYSSMRSMLGSDWLREQAFDIESRVAILHLIRDGRHDEAIEQLESDIDADLIAMVVDGFIRDATIDRIRVMLDSARSYREAYPRETDADFIDSNVARRLSGELTDDPANR